MRASSGALRLASSQPVRIFKVTGTSTALTVASRIRAAWASSRISAEPAMPLTTFFTGHPILMSIIAAPRIAQPLVSPLARAPSKRSTVAGARMRLKDACVSSGHGSFGCRRIKLTVLIKSLANGKARS